MTAVTVTSSETGSSRLASSPTEPKRVEIGRVAQAGTQRGRLLMFTRMSGV